MASFHTTTSRFSDTDSDSFVLTPSSTMNIDDGEDAQGLHARFADALRRCQGSLKTADKLAISKFSTVAELQADLRQKQQEQSDTFLHRLLAQAMPCLSVMGNLSGILVASLPGRSIPTALIWGVLHLAIKTSLESEQRLQSIVSMLTKLEREMHKFEKYSKQLNDVREIRRALVDMFEAIIIFWAAAIPFLKKGPAAERRALELAWPECSLEFTKAMNDVTEAVRTVYNEAVLARVPLPSDTFFGATVHEEQTSFPCYIFAEGDKNFHGRKSALEAIETHFGDCAALGRLGIFTIHGMGGVGKTALALEFGNLCRDRSTYDAIFWINSENSIAIKESFSTIAHRLELLDAPMDDDHDTNNLRVKNWLRKTSKKWFLIYDNLEDPNLLREYLPESPGPVLVTTRRKAVASRISGMNKILELQPFERVDAMELFVSLLKTDPKYAGKPIAFSETEINAAALLLEKLDGLALGIEQMAAYITYRDLSVETFVQKYDKMAMAMRIHKKSEGMKATHSLDTVWALSFNEAEEQNPDAYNIMAIISLLSATSIPLALFESCDEDFGNKYLSFCGDEEKIEDALDLLVHFALITRDGFMVSVHRLIQRAFIYSLDLPNCIQDAFDAATILVERAFPNQVNALPLLEHWPTCQSYIQQAISLADHFHESRSTKRPLQASDRLHNLFKNASWYLFETGAYEEVLYLLKIAYESYPKKDSLVYAHLLNTESAVEYELNRLERCLEVSERCLQIRSTLLDPDDLELASAYSNMASTFSALGEQDKALQYLEKGQKIEELAGEEAAISLALTHMLTGRAYFLKHDFEMATTRYKLSEDIFVRTIGPRSHLMAHLLYALGNLKLASSTDPNDAMKLYQKGYSVSFETSPSHILTGSFHYKLGLIDMGKSKYQSAREHMNKALSIAINRRLDGDTARIRRQIARLIRNDPDASADDKADGIKIEKQAELTRIKLTEGKNVSIDDGAFDWDSLVCGYYR